MENLNFQQKKTIDKMLLNKRSRVCVAISKLDNPTQDEKQKIIDGFINEKFTTDKIKRCTHEFSTPEIVKEALAIMKKDTDNFSHLVLMKKVNKLKANGEIQLSKSTHKPLLAWVKLNK